MCLEFLKLLMLDINLLSGIFERFPIQLCFFTFNLVLIQSGILCDGCCLGYGKCNSSQFLVISYTYSSLQAVNINILISLNTRCTDFPDL